MTLETISLHADDTEARIVPARGGIVTALRVGGHDVLFMDETTLVDPSKNVRGGVPVLFPSPGRLTGDAFRFGAASGSMSQHGFARSTPFEVVEVRRDAARLRLAATDATRAMYPFEFALTLDVTVTRGRLTLDAEVSNHGADTMPYGLGYHPYFAVSLADKARARVPTRASRAWDNVTKETRALAEIALDVGEVDLHLLDHGGARADLALPGGRVVVAGDDGWGRWVVWTLPGRDFVCLEPWTSPADALNTGDGLLTLESGASRVHRVSISWEPEASAAR